MHSFSFSQKGYCILYLYISIYINIYMITKTNASFALKGSLDLKSRDFGLALCEGNHQWPVNPANIEYDNTITKNMRGPDRPSGAHGHLDELQKVESVSKSKLVFIKTHYWINHT